MKVDRPSLILPEESREDFSQPWGPVFSGPLRVLEEIGPKGVICIGDFVSKLCLEAYAAHGKPQNIIVVFDHTSRRVEPAGALEIPGDFSRVKIYNKRGTLSLEALDTVCGLVEMESVKAALEVEGEEDMVTLAAIACLKPGWLTIYGIPGLGSAVIAYSCLNARIAQGRILGLKPLSMACHALD
ncbi:MAG: DUF359 domain-containing protein [Thermoprotei archaeon]|nr:DUF359 domain-containing protein [Thermoprotei archaeon]